MTFHQRVVGELVTALRIGPVPGGWEMAEAALAVIEPIIRADEQKQYGRQSAWVEAGKRQALTDLRAKVEGLRERAEDTAARQAHLPYLRNDHAEGQAYAYEAVLALIDEVR